MTRPVTRSIVALGASALIGLGCRDVTPPVPAASVVIDQVAPRLPVSGTLQFSGTVLDAAGKTLAGRAITWSSSDTSRIKISASGLATWFSPGVCTIIAKSGSAADSVFATSGGDFAIANVVFTQGVQDALGTIPLIKNGNAAAVLVMLTTQATVSTPMKVTLNLLNAADNSLAYTTSATVSTPISPTASTATPTVALLLPAAQIKSNLKWLVIRDPDGASPDDSTVNDVFPRTGAAALSAVDVPPLNIRFVPIVLSANGDAQPSIPDNSLPGYLLTLKAALPVGQVNATVGTPLITSASFGSPTVGGALPFWNQILSEIELARVAAVGVDPTTHWMAVVSPPPLFTFTTYGGIAYVGNPSVPGAVQHSSAVVRTGWFNNPTQSRDLVAHELSHNFGRSHAPCGSAANTDPLFPRPDGTIGAVMHNVFSWLSGTALPTIAATTGDIMGYCFPQWASTYTYSGDLFGRGPGVLTGAGGVAANAASTTGAEDVVVIQGSVRLDGTAAPALLPTVQLRGRQLMPDAAGAFHLTGFDAAGQLLFDHRFAPTPVGEDPGLGTFTFALPLDASMQRLSRLRVSGPTGFTELAEPVTATSSAPIVRRVGVRLIADCGANTRVALQDDVTGQLLGVSNNGSLTLNSRSSRVAVSCARGVVSSRRAFLVP